MRFFIAIWFCLIIAASVTDTRLPAPSPVPQTAIQVVNSVEKPRYRLSLIPGGAGNMLELDLMVQLDPVLQRFYKNFNFDKQREFVIDHDIDVYMSFRVGDDIRWTKKKVHVKKGEEAVTDGTYTILLRCGNMIAWTPQGTDTYPAEPLPPVILETPVPPYAPPIETVFAPESELSSPEIPGPPIGGPYSPETYSPIGTPLYGPLGLAAPPIETAPTPESSTFVLIVVGLGILLLKKGSR